MSRKVIKKMLLVTSCILLLGCGIKKTDSEIPLYKKGLEVIEKMDLMAECKEYIGLMTSNSQMEELIDKIGEKDYTKPNTVYQITIPKEKIQSLLSLVNEEEIQLPEQILPDVYRRFLTAVPTSLNAMEGTEVIAVTAMLMADMDFLYKDLTENTIYLYLYQDAYSAAVLFSPMDQGIVRAQGNFIVNDQLLWNLTEEEIIEMLESTGYLFGCEIQKIEID